MKYLLIFLPLFAIGQIPEPKPNTYVNDFVNVLSFSEIKELNDTLIALESRTSVEIAVVLVSHIDISIEDFALQLGRKWGVGNAGNGIVYIAAIEDHKQRLEIGANVEGSIPDAVAMKITDNLKPNFRSGDYFGGLMVLIKGIKERIDPAFAEQLKILKVQQDKNRRKTEEVVGKVLGGIFILLFLFFFLRPYYRRKREEEEAEQEWYIPPPRDAPPVIISNPDPDRFQTTPTSPPPVFFEMPNEPPIPSTLIESKKPDDDPPSRYESPSTSSDNSSTNTWGNNDNFSGGGSTNDW